VLAVQILQPTSHTFLLLHNKLTKYPKRYFLKGNRELKYEMKIYCEWLEMFVHERLLCQLIRLSLIEFYEILKNNGFLKFKKNVSKKEVFCVTYFANDPYLYEENKICSADKPRHAHSFT